MLHALSWHTAWDLMNLKVGLGCWGCHPSLPPWLFCHKSCGWESFANGTCGFSKFACSVFSPPLMQTCMWFASHIFLPGTHLPFPELCCFSLLCALLAFLQLFQFPYRMSSHQPSAMHLCICTAFYVLLEGSEKWESERQRTTGLSSHLKPDQLSSEAPH